MTSVRLQQVTKRFGAVVAADNVDLEIASGEFLVLVGPSGCGKTTLLHLIAGLLDATSGTIYFDKADMSRIPPGERDVAMIFQEHALFPHMTVERNLGFGLPPANRTEQHAQVQELARRLGIEALLNHYPHELSGGQQQRVALGRALIRHPAVFLFDEPLSDLDPMLRAELRAEILNLHQEFRTTTVYVTHDHTEAMTMGQRMAVMNEGRILQLGAPLDIYRNPADVFTAGFIGSPAMNLLEVHVEAVAGVLRCRGRAGFNLLVDAADVNWQPDWPDRVTLGVRPEDLRLCSPDDNNAIEARVVLVEKLGRECILHLQHGDLALTCITGNGVPPDKDEHIHVAPQAGKLLAFDTNTGLHLR